MQATPLTYLKFGLIALIVAVIGAAILTGKIDVTPGVGLITGSVGMLVLSLGIASAGQQIGQQTALAIQAHTRAMVSQADALAAPDRANRGGPLGGQHGFVSFRALLTLAGVGALVVIGILAIANLFACTKEQGAAVETVGENIAICALNVSEQDILSGVTDEGQIATDVFTKCIGPNATAEQKAGVLAILEAGTKLRLAKAPAGAK